MMKSAVAAVQYAPEAMVEIPPEAIPKLCAELRRLKKKYGALELVELDTAGGDHVKITL